VRRITAAREQSGTVMSDRNAEFAVRVFELVETPGNYLYDLVADHLIARIRSGELAVNTPLLAEGDLARQYGVSLGTVRHATRLLRERGLVLTVRSKGTYVVRRVDHVRAFAVEADPAVPSVVLNGTDLAGNPVPVLIERRETGQGLAAQMRLGESSVVLSSVLLDEFGIARTTVLADGDSESESPVNKTEVGWL
jgi:DNA-binding transcriptional regulator YhcF (GntR family)